ncbi:MAG: tRNA glutamyl-Q(34) synthetase GluQRS [bacterium]
MPAKRPTQSATPDVSSIYRGRFAPSPTGALHFGSMVTAIASYLDAKAHQGKWLLRIEDIDTTRTQLHAVNDILYGLERFGLYWDEAITYQTQRLALYEAALAALGDYVYPCSCTRKQLLRDTGITQGAFGYIYTGRCRQGMLLADKPRFSYRLKTHNTPVCVQDTLQGDLCQSLESELGDFILKRTDGLFAYQLVVVVDDAEQGITHIVRGMDLWDNTPRQAYLQQLLGYPQPQYVHIPVATYANGRKLSKQNRATPIHHEVPLVVLHRVLQFLGQQPPALQDFATLDDLWQWAIIHWRLSAIPQQKAIVV